jgi:hypothetical protein
LRVFHGFAFGFEPNDLLLGVVMTLTTERR